MGPPPFELIITMVERDRVQLEVDDHDVALRRQTLVRLARVSTPLRRALQRGAPRRHLPVTPPSSPGNPPFAHGS